MKLWLFEFSKLDVQGSRVRSFIFNEGGKYMTFSAHLTTGVKPGVLIRLWIQYIEFQFTVGRTK